MLSSALTLLLGISAALALPANSTAPFKQRTCGSHLTPEQAESAEAAFQQALTAKGASLSSFSGELFILAIQ